MLYVDPVQVICDESPSIETRGKMSIKNVPLSIKESAGTADNNSGPLTFISPTKGVISIISQREPARAKCYINNLDNPEQRV